MYNHRIRPCKSCFRARGTIKNLCTKCHDIKQRFRLNPRDVYMLRAQQYDRCAICLKSSKENGRALALSHTKDGAPKGFLCIRCNLGIGYFSTVELLQAAISYTNLPLPDLRSTPPPRPRVSDEENVVLGRVYVDDSLTSLHKKGEKLAELLPGLSKHAAISRLRRYKEWVEEKDEDGEETFDTPQIPLDIQE